MLVYIPLTHFNDFLPVPITVKVIQCVMAVASIFLLHASSSLVGFCPGRLNTLPAGAPNIWCIIEGVSVHTVVLVVTDVHLRDATNGTLNDRDKVQEPFLEAFDLVDAVLAFNFITKIDVWHVFVLLEHSG